MSSIDPQVAVYTKARMGLVICAYKKIIHKMDQENSYCWPIARLNDYLNYYPNELLGKRQSGVEICIYDEYDKFVLEHQEYLNPEREFVHREYLIDIVELFVYVCNKITYTMNLTHPAFVKIWQAGKYADRFAVAMEKWDPIDSHYLKKPVWPRFTKAKMVLVIQGYRTVMNLMEEKNEYMWRRTDVNYYLADAVKLQYDEKNYEIYYGLLINVIELFDFVCGKVSYADNMSWDEYCKICRLKTDDALIVPALEYGPMGNDL